MLKPATDDVRILTLRPLMPAAILLDELPLSGDGERTVTEARDAIARSLRGDDDRLVVICGPCSIHDVQAAREYARLLKLQADRFRDDLLLVMRVYFEKPRTTVGWKGLINDPDLDGTFQINKGLRLARGLLVDLAELGLPAACEFLDTISPQFTADLVAWGAIGARTTESQIHRELASGLSMPVGFKNGTAGSADIAVEAILAASHRHTFLSVTKQGLAAIVHTGGNPACHVILRGGKTTGPNYHPDFVASVAAQLEARGLPARLMVDASHGNSEKDYRRQTTVIRDLADQVSQGSRALFGVMIESHLVAGRQDTRPGEPLTHVPGQRREAPWAQGPAALSLTKTRPLVCRMAVLTS
jgi:3-deoxy-7-phosphoheptulonate synthase